MGEKVRFFLFPFPFLPLPFQNSSSPKLLGNVSQYRHQRRAVNERSWACLLQAVKLEQGEYVLAWGRILA